VIRITTKKDNFENEPEWGMGKVNRGNWKGEGRYKTIVYGLWTRNL
jgi:hypothetical protein